MRNQSPEQFIAALLDMRATLEPAVASDRTRALLAERGRAFDEELWETFFDPEELLDNALYDAARALWELEWSDKHGVEPRAALLAFEAAKDAGLVLAAFAFAQALDWLGDERAESELREFVTLHPDWEDPRLFGILGGLTADFYDDEDHLHEALMFLERVGDSEPLWIQWRALAIAKLGRVREARALLDDQVAAGDRDALRTLGDIHRVSDDVESAKSAYIRAIAVGDAIAARRLGIVLAEQGDEQAATRAFAVGAVRGDAYSASEVNDAAILLKRDDRIDEALVLLRVSWGAGERNAGYNLASTLDQTHQFREAREIWKVLADGGDVDAMIEYGESAASDRDLPEAREYLRRALEIGTPEQRATASAHLGLTYDVTLAGDEAVDVRGLLELGATVLPGARAALGWLHAKAGREAEAVSVWTSGLHADEADSIASLGAFGSHSAEPVNSLALVDRVLAGDAGVEFYNIGSLLVEVGEDAVAARFMARAVALGDHEDAERWLAAHESEVGEVRRITSTVGGLP